MPPTSPTTTSAARSGAATANSTRRALPLYLPPPLLTASLDARDFTGAAADDGDDEFTLGGAEQFRSREENSIKDALISLKS